MFAKCMTSEGLIGKIPAAELRKDAAIYQKRGMDASAAMTRAVEDRLRMLAMEERKIVQTVRAAYEADGGTRPIPKARAAKVVADPKVDAIRKAIAADTFHHEVDVYASMDEAPDYIRRQAEAEGATDVEGFFDPRTNRVALIANNLASIERAREVARHELIGHYGLENMVGRNEMVGLAGRVIQAEQDGNKTIIEVAEQVDRTQPGLSPQRRAKEIIAVMAERNLQNSITKRVIDAIRKFLKQAGFLKSDITDAEIAGLLRDAQTYLRERGRQMEAGEAAPAFSRDQASMSRSAEDAQSELDVVPRDPLKASDLVATTRDVSGRRRWTAGQKAYDALTDAINPLLAKVKLSNDAPDAFKQMMRQFAVDQNKALENAKRVAETGVATLTPEQRVLISDIIEQNVAAADLPPEEVVKIAADIQAALQQQAQDLIDLGMATEDRLIENYLPRAYRNPLLAKITNKDQFVSWYQKAKLRMNGNRLKSRGLVKKVDAKDIGKYQALNWKISSMADGEDIPADLLDALEAGKAPPPQYANDMQVLMWRDFTADERAEMGEIRDGLLRYAMGYTETQRDIAIGRLFKAIADNDELSSKVNPGGWTKVPDQKIPGTELKRYGALSGLYVPPYVRDVIERNTQPKGPLMQVYDKALSFWKEGKTVWNPVSHGNNVISNVFTAYFAGINLVNPLTAPKIWRGTVREYRTKGRFYQEAVDNGLFGTEFASKEIQELFLPDLTGELDAEVVIASRFNKVVESLKKTGKPVAWYRDRMQKAYEFEDQFFKLMLFIDRRQNGASIEDAIADTERYIFNYSDVPEGVQLIKRVYSPFFSYTYKALPMVIHTAMTRPDRLLLPIMLLGGANWLAYALMGGDEDEERRGMPDYLQGRTAIGTPKAVRMPFNVGDRPAFMDISRRVPLGDLFDLHNQTGGLAVPAPFMPSHPLFTATAAMLLNMDTFTGKDLVKKSDTGWEAAETRANWAWKQIAPNAPFVPGTWNFDKLMNGTANAFDTEMMGYTGYTKAGDPTPLSLALLDVAGGTKIRSFDPQRGKDFKQYETGKERREIQANIRSAQRNKAMTPGARAEYVNEQRAKLQRLGKDD